MADIETHEFNYALMPHHGKYIQESVVSLPQCLTDKSMVDLSMCPICPSNWIRFRGYNYNSKQTIHSETKELVVMVFLFSQVKKNLHFGRTSVPIYN
jgi:hypothetical protein